MNREGQECQRLVTRRDQLIWQLRSIPTGRGPDVDEIKREIDRVNSQIARTSNPATARVKAR